MNTRNLLTALFLFIAVATQTALAVSRPSESSVTVLAHGPAGLRIEGKSATLSFEEDASELTFRVPLAPIETGIGLRDRHLREMLEAEKFPAAVLRVPRSGLSFPADQAPTEGTARGELNLHGQSRPVQVQYRAEMGKAGVTKVRGSMRIDMRDFEIKSPSYLGVTVAPEVEVKVELSLEER
jgi:polyisoprenoid-binding protein YceI